MKERIFFSFFLFFVSFCINCINFFLFFTDLRSSSDAAKYTVGQLQGDFAVIRKGMKTVATEVEWAKKSDNAEAFVDLMGPFAEAARRKVESTENKLQSLKETFEVMVSDFGENAAKTEMDAFFKIITHFMDVFRGAIAKVEATEGGMKLTDE